MGQLWFRRHISGDRDLPRFHVCMKCVIGTAELASPRAQRCPVIWDLSWRRGRNFSSREEFTCGGLVIGMQVDLELGCSSSAQVPVAVLPPPPSACTAPSAAGGLGAAETRTRVRTLAGRTRRPVTTPAAPAPSDRAEPITRYGLARHAIGERGTHWFPGTPRGSRGTRGTARNTRLRSFCGFQQSMTLITVLPYAAIAPA